MRFDILTIFPEYFLSPLRQSVIGRAIDKGLITVSLVNIRDFAVDKHKTTDDYPYGGGCGMVMKIEPLAAAIESLNRGGGGKPFVVLTSAQGVLFNDSIARELAFKQNRVSIVCGRYEGVDERVKAFINMEVSVGDYVLTGGEAAALVIIDAASRFVPGVLGSEVSSERDSFAAGLLEGPQYTRPEEFRGVSAPEVLLSGNHRAIEKWRRLESIRTTLKARPDLLEKAGLTEDEIKALEEIKSGA